MMRQRHSPPSELKALCDDLQERGRQAKDAGNSGKQAGYHVACWSIRRCRGTESILAEIDWYLKDAEEMTASPTFGKTYQQRIIALKDARQEVVRAMAQHEHV